MEYRSLGRSGLKVSVMSLGTNAFGFRADEPTSIKIVQQALDLGINLIDTADVYTAGESERLVGKALRGRRSQAILATKGFGRMGDGPNDAGASRKHLLDAVDASLKRLETDYIDLYQMHNWDPNTPIEETLRTLDDLVRWGKVRYIGCSNYTAWQIIKSLWVSDKYGLERFISNQPEYSPANRKIEREVIPACLAEGVGQIVYFPLAAGLLTGKYKRGEAPPPGSRAVTQGERFTRNWFTEEKWNLAEQMEALAAEAGLPVSHLTLAWVMAKPGVTSAIVGASRAEQVVENVKATEVKLSADLIARIDEISAPHR
ncbi:MAG: aldo/keto reductase [Bacillota bacterium]